MLSVTFPRLSVTFPRALCHIPMCTLSHSHVLSVTFPCALCHIPTCSLSHSHGSLSHSHDWEDRHIQYRPFKHDASCTLSTPIPRPVRDLGMGLAVVYSTCPLPPHYSLPLSFFPLNSISWSHFPLLSSPCPPPLQWQRDGSKRCSYFEGKSQSSCRHIRVCT